MEEDLNRYDCHSVQLKCHSTPHARYVYAWLEVPGVAENRWGDGQKTDRATICELLSSIYYSQYPIHDNI